MGNFANTLFSVMLGWIRGTAEWLWSVTGSQSDGGLIGWIGENWLALILIVCGVGLLMDFIVHMFRWRPYRVWASFLRRITGRDGDDRASDSGRLRRQWIHADGTTHFDEIPMEEAPEELPQMEQPAPAPAEPLAQMDYSPYARPVEQRSAEIPAEMNVPVPTPETVQRPPRNPVRRRRYLPGDEDEMPLRYAPPPSAEDAPVYNAPYIPPQWRKPSNAGATTNTLDDGGGV